ncbi:hypothetical protein LTR91_012186 [Friedmanniomyces endolithicus]|uniref:Glycosyl transferase CAP10 domain-containing protein n=1 Tax=Friedmanniomyces endolithicus TaxID=329885 RepID=A0AAN6KFS1_9PEZI|nr:hypothetical protein LTS01_014469 [Friedmanniomyces endolithicus]KAK0980539.1 hypothetical protein LTR91_012186 [Friedmanniomyces endolithicus]KAK1038838.1 hypothetical protein LTS16_011665 [Friedmanniomyces endolithicus]
MTSVKLTGIFRRSSRSCPGGNRVLKYLILATTILTCTIVYFIYETLNFAGRVDHIHASDAAPSVSQEHEHPIEKLIIYAQAEQGRLLSRQSHNLSTAVMRYQERRGRRPPPEFDAWFNYAQEHDAIVVEDFFDRIYDDLNPFWTLEPREMRRRSAPWAHEHVISVRNRKAILQTNHADPMGRMPQWHRLVEELAQWLPDVDLPVNVMDESRLLVPWEEINERVQQEAAARRVAPPSEVRTEFTGEGSFIEPVSISTTQSLIPFFGGSKLRQNNDLLLPPAMYLSTDELYAGRGDRGPEWIQKKAGVVWRGVASGGRNKAETWTHFHRHRYVQMLNGTAVHEAEIGSLPAEGTTFKLPAQGHYSLVAPGNGSLGGWLSNVTDVAFTRLECFPLPSTPADETLCSYTNPYFEVRPPIPMHAQYGFKYLPDVDGNSYSGRFRAFLSDSGSVVLKATLYDEWHDSRLMPWLHFVPLDNTFIDVYGILEFFLATEDNGVHDELAERIAREGRVWANKVLRRADMALYMWRLILEFARLCDDRRDVLGWIDDLDS